MSARLIALKAGSAPSIALQRPVLLIGRHPECDVRLALSTISRHRRPRVRSPAAQGFELHASGRSRSGYLTALSTRAYNPQIRSLTAIVRAVGGHEARPN